MSGVPDSFRALRIHQHDGGVQARFETLQLADLSAGDVVVRVTHSGINYKDVLAATGTGRILRRFPLVGGIDLAGTVLSSDDARFRSGDAVLCFGGGLSETLDGGYSEIARVPADLLVPMPAWLDGERAMALGTAGFTAALAIDRLEHQGLAPGQGPMLVTGAAGGVGSLAVDMLAARGYEVTAVTGRAASLEGWLRELGASALLPRAEFERPAPPLAKARWAGAIDNAGGAILHALLAGTRAGGAVASIGLVAGAELHTTVMPFILRGVSLLGINYFEITPAQRARVWQRLATDLQPRHLARIVSGVVPFDALPDAFQAYLDGTVRGRQVVRLG
jgi:NADPH2:quinone reductase